nr:hypothetical protein [Tanacetum cinerariifolium]
MIKDIDKVLKGYLLCNDEISKGKAKVAWKNVCKPKSKGDSMWVDWIKVMRLKGKCIWTIKHDLNASCGWNQMLDLRDKMRKHVEYKIKDGTSIFLWHDKWLGDSSLCDLIPNEVLQRSNMNDVKIRDMVRNGCKDRVVWKTSDGNNVSIELGWIGELKRRLCHDKGGLVFTLDTQTLFHILVSYIG